MSYAASSLTTGLRPNSMARREEKSEDSTGSLLVEIITLSYRSTHYSHEMTGLPCLLDTSFAAKYLEFMLV